MKRLVTVTMIMAILVVLTLRVHNARQYQAGEEDYPSVGGGFSETSSSPFTSGFLIRMAQ